MKVTSASLMIEGARLEGENPLPMFRSKQQHREVTDNGSLTPELKHHMGENTGERYLPYRIQDRYSRKRDAMELKTIVLENDILRAVFLPEYGGRLYSLQEKSTGRELLYKNPVFQPANLAILNAWFSGGIEWNIGQIGHTFTTCSPLHAAKLRDDEGNEFLRMYEYERCKGLFWHIDFHLPPGAGQLGVYARIVNDQAAEVPMYWWTNIAVEETEKSRVFSGTADVIYIDPGKGYGADRMPYLPAVPGADVSYPMAFPYASEYFFQTPVSERSPWEAVAYEDGRMFFERSTSMLRYRKMFCWGAHIGGRRWCDFLAKPGEGHYIEVQAGLAPTQLHGIEMPADSVWDFTQLIGGLSDADLDRVYQDDWELARQYVESRIGDVLSEDDVYVAHAKHQALADRAPEELLHTGSGWGALERVRRASEGGRSIPRGFEFADETLGAQQQPWLTLLREGRLPLHEVDEVPSSWMIQEEWMDKLSTSIRRPQGGAGATWNAYLHYGVMLYERGQEEEAIEAWEASLRLAPSAWAYRNLAVAKRQQGENEQALGYYEQAYAVSGSFPDRAFVEEYLGLLIQHRAFERAWSVYESLPQQFYESDRIQIIVGAAAHELGHDAFMEKLFEAEFAVIREGETLIIELWYAYNAKKLAEQQGVGLTKERIEEAKLLFPPPSGIDFRTIG
ncbi:DUF5107 domain-containing protein [Paenibacillus albus]|uniref:DUF5107 domain-containing protein n=1 Tax=Paenibacillus albus TaxID=2495582 RepID=A0A3S9A8B4_9BACL|nr:DUF5107 domain-containing protein [Paenibacillus albus]AZN41876.1 DUF5107 domain-containing protein [Paenibacillus albus]